MSKEFTDFGLDKGQYDFFGIVTEPGQFHGWHGVTDSTQRKNPLIIEEDLKGFRRKKEKFEKDEFLAIYRIPERLIPENTFIAFSEGQGYPNDIDVTFVDKESGLVMSRLSFEEIDPDDNKPKSERKFKPAMLENFSYEEKTIEHPLTGEETRGIFFTSYCWHLDSVYRRYSRLDVQQVFAHFSEEWDSGSGVPRELEYIIIASDFAPLSGEEDRPIREGAKYLEKGRFFHTSEPMIGYASVGYPPKLKFNPTKHHSIEEYVLEGKVIKSEDLPLYLGDPVIVEF